MLHDTGKSNMHTPLYFWLQILAELLKGCTLRVTEALR